MQHVTAERTVPVRTSRPIRARRRPATAVAVLLAMGSSAAGAGGNDFKLASDGEVHGPIQMLIGPVAGVTSAWHIAPAETCVPLGVPLHFKVVVPPTAIVTWIGAEEVQRTDEASFAVCAPEAIGPAAVFAIVQVPGDPPPAEAPAGSGTDEADASAEMCTCALDVVDVTPAEILVSDIVVGMEPALSLDLSLPQEVLNELAVGEYFGPSIAAVTTDGPGSYHTSIDRPVAMSVAGVDPPGFAPLIEWRVDGEAIALRSAVILALETTGVHEVRAGPLAAPSAPVHVQAYRVDLISPTSPDALTDGAPLVCVAVTDPPGFENEITWLAATKYGWTESVVGTGPVFFTAFHDTLGPLPGDPDGLWRWLGVKADNAAMGKDEKPEEDCDDIPGVPALEVPIPPEAIPEGEPCCADPASGGGINGGCGGDIGSCSFAGRTLAASGGPFSPMSCDTSIHGTSWTFMGSRDVDWYELDLRDGAGPLHLTFSLNTELPLVMGLADNGGEADCDLVSGLDPTTTVFPGLQGSVTVCVDPGTYWLVLHPTDCAGYPFGSDSDYVIRINCHAPDAGAGSALEALATIDELCLVLDGFMLHCMSFKDEFTMPLATAMAGLLAELDDLEAKLDSAAADAAACGACATEAIAVIAAIKAGPLAAAKQEVLDASTQRKRIKLQGECIDNIKGQIEDQKDEATGKLLQSPPAKGAAGAEIARALNKLQNIDRRLAEISDLRKRLVVKMADTLAALGDVSDDIAAAIAAIAPCGPCANAAIADLLALDAQLTGTAIPLAATLADLAADAEALVKTLQLDVDAAEAKGAQAVEVIGECEVGRAE